MIAASPADPRTRALLEWYGRHRRRLPWRALPGEAADPYRVWLSEIMLQQTTVETVKPYFEKFLALWPDVAALARADDADVLAAWAGLGYYARARNLLACARRLADTHDGVFPGTETALRALPGIGAYTAAAIAAIAFGRPAIVIDGNIERVIARLAVIATPLPAAKAEIARILGPMVPRDQPGDFAQGLMDLGAAICRPRNPECRLCPLRPHCAAAKAGNPADYPVKVRKGPKPVRFGIAYVALGPDGGILLRTRGQKGLLAGMTEVPGTEWAATLPAPAPPFPAGWQAVSGPVVHVFTHFELRLTVMVAQFGALLAPPPGLRWVGPADRAREPLPVLMNKVIAAAKAAQAAA